MGFLITFQNGYGGGENDFHGPALVASCSCFKRGWKLRRNSDSAHVGSLPPAKDTKCLFLQ